VTYHDESSSMNHVEQMRLEPSQTQRARWPREGRHILAQYDADTICVYHAYSRAIAAPAARDGRFGPPWSRSRMTWIKPGFLWMIEAGAKERLMMPREDVYPVDDTAVAKKLGLEA
jgi:Domain of unknown function (DUF4291)